MHPHATRRDLARTAWIQATSYAATATTRTGAPRRHTQAWARAAWPGITLAHWVMGHRNLYLTTSRQGVICLYGTPAIGMAARGVALIAPLVVTLLLPSLTLDIIVTLAYLTLFASLTASLVLSGARSRAPRGTKKINLPWRRYVVGLAAAHPDAPTGETLLLARTLLHRLPPRSTVIVHPRTPELRVAYQRFGFKPSKGLAMVRGVL